MRSAAVVDQVLAANPKVVEDCRRGKKAAAKALVGQVMKATGGKANPGAGEPAPGGETLAKALIRLRL